MKRQVMDEHRRIEYVWVERALRARKQREEKRAEIRLLAGQLGLTRQGLSTVLRKHGYDGIIPELRLLQKRRAIIPLFETEFSLLRKAA